MANNVQCKGCGTVSNGKYCSNCGQSLTVKRLSLPELLHEAFHLFTHVEHGFLYTLKMLVTHPGLAQKEYIEGCRIKHQKPFSMFFLSATISALIYYWINSAILTYMHYGNHSTAEFFHKNFVLLHVCMIPFYSLITYVCFKKAGYNYGEIAVYQLYTFSFIFLMISVLQAVKFWSPSFQTRYIEVPFVATYVLITNLKFFNQLRKSTIIVVSIICIGLIFLAAAFTQDRVMDFLYYHK